MVYRPNKKSEGAIELGEAINVDFADGEVVGVQIDGASKILATLTGCSIKKENLENIIEAKIVTKHTRGALVLVLLLVMEAVKQPIESRLILPEITAR